MSAKTLDDSAIEKKFLNAKNTQESIQTVSTWVLHCKSQHSKIVEVWLNVIKKSKLQLRLTLFYLCNEIVQTCKRKHAPVYKDSFKLVLPEATCLVRDESLHSSIERIFTVWQERCVFESEFVDELLTVLHTEPTKTPVVVATKLVADFKPSTAREMVLAMCQFEKEIETKKRKLNLVNFDELTQKHFKQLKDRTHGKQYSQQVEETHHNLSEFVSSLEDEFTLRQETIEQLEQSELFYDVQYGEAKIVTNAYKNFGTRVSNLRKRLEDVKRTLPDPLSPIPSPSIDAPSPGESLTDPTDHQIAPDNSTTQDNTEAVDMELSSDDENPGGEAYSPGAGADSPDSDPSPIDFQVHPATTNPETMELNSAENLSTVTVNNHSSSLSAIDYGSSFLSQLPLAGQTIDGLTASSNGGSGTINLFSMLAGLIKQQPLTTDSAVTSITTELSKPNVYVLSAPVVSQLAETVISVNSMQNVSTTLSSSCSMSVLSSSSVLGAVAPGEADVLLTDRGIYCSSSQHNVILSVPVNGETNYSAFSTRELVSASCSSIVSYSNISGGTGASLAQSGKVHSLPSIGFTTSLLPQLEAAVSGVVAPVASDVHISPYYGTDDEDGSTTPVQDELPECSVEPQQTSSRVAADPIALLNQLLSKGKSNTVVSSNSSNFLHSLTMLTKGASVDPRDSKSSAATLAVDSPRDDIYVGGYEDSTSVSDPIVVSNLDPSPPLAFKAFFIASKACDVPLVSAVPVMSAVGNIPPAAAAVSQHLMLPPPLPPIICSSSNYSCTVATNVCSASATFQTGQDTLGGKQDAIWSDRRHLLDSSRGASERVPQTAGMLASQNSGGGPSVLYTTPLPHTEEVHLSSQTVNRDVTVNNEPIANYRQAELLPQSFSPKDPLIQYHHREPSAASRHPDPPHGDLYPTYRPSLEAVSTELRVVTDYGHASHGAEVQRYQQPPGRPGNGAMSPSFRQPGDVTTDGMEFAERLRRKTSALAAPLSGDMNSPRFASEEQIHGYFDDDGAPLSHGNYDSLSRCTDMPSHAPMYRDQRDWHQNAGPHANRHPGPLFPRPDFRHAALPMSADRGFCDEMPPHHELRPRFAPRLLPPPSMPQLAPRPPPPPQFQRPYYPRY